MQANPAAQQGGCAAAAGMQGMYNPFGAMNAFMTPYGGMPYGGGGGAMPGMGGGFNKGGGKGKGDHHYFKGGKGFKDGGKGFKGKGFKGEKGEKGFDKGEGKGKYGGFGGDGAYDFSGDPRRQIMLAQRRAKGRERGAIAQAQKSAQLRFEKDLLDRVQGSWVDESDNTSGFVVEGSICAVSGGDNARVFRNKISVYGGNLCWDAKRFWHYLDLKSLPPAEEGELQTVTWKPGEGSPPTRPITWVRGSPPPKPEAEEAKTDEAKAEGEEAAAPEAPPAEAAKADDAS